MWRHLFSLALLSVAVACSGTDSGEGNLAAGGSLPSIKPFEPDFPPIEYRQLDLAVHSPDGQRATTFRVYDPVNRASRIHGLMGVTDLPPDAGMLFRFAAPQESGFWMKNTLIPLDMIFIGKDRKIIGVVENAAPETETERMVGAPSQYVLEISGGLSAKLGIRRGEPVDFQNFPLPAP